MITVIHSARHMDDNALALCALTKDLETAALQDAAVNVKRTKTDSIPDYSADSAQGLDWIKPFLEIKTTWHPAAW